MYQGVMPRLSMNYHMLNQMQQRATALRYELANATRMLAQVNHPYSYCAAHLQPRAYVGSPLQNRGIVAYPPSNYCYGNPGAFGGRMVRAVAPNHGFSQFRSPYSPLQYPRPINTFMPQIPLPQRQASPIFGMPMMNRMGWPAVPSPYLANQPSPQSKDDLEEEEDAESGFYDGSSVATDRSEEIANLADVIDEEELEDDEFVDTKPAVIGDTDSDVIQTQVKPDNASETVVDVASADTAGVEEEASSATEQGDNQSGNPQAPPAESTLLVPDVGNAASEPTQASVAAEQREAQMSDTNLLDMTSPPSGPPTLTPAVAATESASIPSGNKKKDETTTEDFETRVRESFNTEPVSTDDFKHHKHESVGKSNGVGYHSSDIEYWKHEGLLEEAGEPPFVKNQEKRKEWIELRKIEDEVLAFQGEYKGLIEFLANPVEKGRKMEGIRFYNSTVSVPKDKYGYTSYTADSLKHIGDYDYRTAKEKLIERNPAIKRYLENKQKCAEMANLDAEIYSFRQGEREAILSMGKAKIKLLFEEREVGFLMEEFENNYGSIFSDYSLSNFNDFLRKEQEKKETENARELALFEREIKAMRKPDYSGAQMTESELRAKVDEEKERLVKIGKLKKETQALKDVLKDVEGVQQIMRRMLKSCG